MRLHRYGIFLQVFSFKFDWEDILTVKTIFDQIFKHHEVYIFNCLLHVWKWAQIRSLVFDILRHSVQNPFRISIICLFLFYRIFVTTMLVSIFLLLSLSSFTKISSHIINCILFWLLAELRSFNYFLKDGNSKTVNDGICERISQTKNYK